MIPVCRKLNASGQWIVYKITPTTEVEWVDYVPVQVVADVAGTENRHENNGHMQADTLASVTGLVAWVDYTPVRLVTLRTDAWRVESTGYIPIVDETP